MTAASAAAILAALSVALLVRHPASALNRLGRAPLVPAKNSSALGARSLRQRVLIGGALALLIAVALGDLVGVVVGTALGGAATVFLGRTRPSRAERELPGELPEALDFLAVCLEVGLPMRQAVESVAAVSRPTTSQLLATVSARLALGREPASVWRDVAVHGAWARAAADIARSERSGTSLVAGLRTHAEEARREVRDAALKRARSVGVRSVLPLMLCFLPAFILVGVVPIVVGLLGSFLSAGP